MAFGVSSTVYGRWLAPLFALLVVMQLTACSDKEADQREAFSDFLQNTALRSTEQLPTLSEDQKQKFGNYAGDYAILTTFSLQMKQAVDASLTPALVQINLIRVPQDYLLQRDALQQSVGALNLLGQQIQTAKAQADTAHATLKHPDVLKKVYDQLFGKVVTQPANAIMPLIPETASFMQDLVQVGDFLKAQGNQVTYSGASIQFPSQSQANQYNTMMSSLVAKHHSLLAAQQNAAKAAQN